MTQFSVLMTVYDKEKPECFYKSLNSVLVEQTRKPDQFVLVYDGPLNNELSRIAESFRGKFANEFLILKLPENVGRGKASNEGLKKCKYNLVARMDSDDISYPDRFESELEVFESNPDVDVVGGYITEFRDTPDNKTGIRKVPENHPEIARRFRHRMAMNNVCVMYKKDAVEEVGGYQSMLSGEDFNLYARLLIANKKFYNIQKPLVNVRVGDNMLERRGKQTLYQSWKRNQRILYKGGIINTLEYLENCFLCYCFVMCPQKVKGFLYKYILRTRV